jgi:hypothetical protein
MGARFLRTSLTPGALLQRNAPDLCAGNRRDIESTHYTRLEMSGQAIKEKGT